MEQFEIEMMKAAEAAEILDAEGATFGSEDEALEAIQDVVDEDYAEKIASVCEEFDADNYEFESDEEKVAAAMEVVDGYEEAMAKEAATKQHKAIVAGSALAGAAGGHAALTKGFKGHRAAFKGHMPAEGTGKVKSLLGRLKATAKHNPFKDASKRRIAALVGGSVGGAAGAGILANKAHRG